MSDNLVVQNLINALNTWNEKLSEIWPLLTTIPQEFKGGGIWNVMVNINYWSSSAYFILCGRSCKNLWLIYRGKEARTRIKIICKICNCQRCCYLWELMLALFNIVQETIASIMNASGINQIGATTLPQEMITTIEECGFFESISLWAITLIDGLLITVLSFILIMSVYGRFFKLYMYTALAPIPLSTFAGEPSQNIGKSFIKSYSAILLEGAAILLACIIFSLFASTPPVVDTSVAAVNCYAIESYVK